LLIGIPGIFLALPAIAILKIIFDRIEELKPWGILIGDDTRVIVRKKLFNLTRQTTVQETTEPPRAGEIK